MNQLRLTASVVALDALRHTPVGIPALNLLMEHVGEVQELGVNRQVQIQIKAVAFGALAERLASLPLGTMALCEGFLATLAKTKTLCLHLQHFEIAAFATNSGKSLS